MKRVNFEMGSNKQVQKLEWLINTRRFKTSCCERFMQLFRSMDGGATWCSYGNPFQGPYGGMQAIYQMCEVGSGVVFAACQPDSTILRWPVETLR